ncbi:MAG TPA: DUF87 domain-containing protein, partial [Candidatus Saccharimonadales bacterium]|nr:DUF87 domain-containing protein [Candidatus Saccharimonadales bacterium]
ALNPPEHTAMMLNVFESLAKHDSLIASFFLPREPVFLEIASGDKDNMRIFLCVPTRKASEYKRAAEACLTGCEIRGGETRRHKAGVSINSMPLRLRKRYFYPLAVENPSADSLVNISKLITANQNNQAKIFQISLKPTGRVINWRSIRYRRSHPQELQASAKLSKPLLKTSFRAVAIGSTETEALQFTHELSSALSNLNHKGQKILTQRSYSKRFEAWKFMNYKSDLMTINKILSADEISLLFHPPSKLEQDIARSRETELKLPPSLRSRKLNLVIGTNTVGGKSYDFGLSGRERKRHILLLGSTGTGKSTLLLNMICQDVANDQGVVVIDPHGDLADSVLERIPRHRIEDVIYINPALIDKPIGINLLALKSRPGTNEYLIEVDRITEAAVSLLRKIFSDNETGGNRNEYIFRNAVHTALTLENCTLFTVYRLLTDNHFRQATVSNLNDNSLRRFWNEEYSQAGSMQRVKLSLGVTSKLGRLLRSTTTRRIFGQADSTIDFDEALNAGKIIVCDLSKGKLGEDSSNVLGVSILLQLQLAAYRRQLQTASSRRPVYVYVDEFQNFATPSFAQLLSESRKYGLFLTLAEQSLQQQAANIQNIVLANVGCMAVFRCTSQTDESIVGPLLAAGAQKSDLFNLPDYNFYMRMLTDDGAYVFEGTTLLPVKPLVSKDAVIRSSLKANTAQLN